VKKIGSMTTTTISLNDYYKKYPDRINILKLDIQGSELSALKGASDLLAGQLIDIIFTETYFIQQYKEQPLFHEIAAYLHGFEYQLQDLYNPYYGNGKIAWCDSLFIRNRLK
jgi:hypothetical protein